MEPEDSLPYSEGSTTGPYPKQDASSPQLPSYFPNIHFTIILIFAPSLPMSSPLYVFHILPTI
jgi:hypothetical protein